MKQKAFTLLNKGMNRDLSISKAGESSAYTNHNIRVLARDHDTLLSVTNERGTKEISLGASILGTVIGWNVLNNHVILFTHQSGDGITNPDHIYRIDYTSSGFVMRKGKENAYTLNASLFDGDLNFGVESPIESVVYYETEDIQKIYWTDGVNPLRMMNFMADATERGYWDNDYFDSNRSVAFNINARIEKDNAGNPRPNGVAQYLITYFNDHAQETGYAWISDLVYLSPLEAGGAEDSQNTNRVKIIAKLLDGRYTNIRVYSIFRSSYDGQTVAYLVGERNVPSGPDGITEEVTVVDDGAHLVSVDPAKLLFLGSQDVHFGTMTHKDGTLFLGDITMDSSDLAGLEEKIRKRMFLPEGSQTYDANSEIEWEEGVNWRARCVEFVYSDGLNAKHIPYVENTGAYPYNNQLQYTSSEITTFKGGEKYRFGLMFRLPNGVNTEVFWIGDKVNYKYPVIDETNKVIKRAIAKCTVPTTIMDMAKDLGLKGVQLMIAEATYADRSVKAQGLINPTVFNVWNRYNNRLYASPSWVSRPRNSSFACRHFEPIHNASTTTGEIQCNYWETENAPAPYYQLQEYETEDSNYVEEFDGDTGYEDTMVLYRIRCVANKYDLQAFVIQANLSTASGAQTALNAFQFTDEMFMFDATSLGRTKFITEDLFSLKLSQTLQIQGARRKDKSYTDAMNQVNRYLNDSLGITSTSMKVDLDTMSNWANHAEKDRRTWFYYNLRYPNVSDAKTKLEDAINQPHPDIDPQSRWFAETYEGLSLSGSALPSYKKKHIFFVDENTVTLDSPEITLGAVSFDKTENHYLRIIGVAKVDNCISDSTVDASHGKLSGHNFVNENFSGFGAGAYLDGLITWPLWEEYGLSQREADQDAGYDGFPEDIKTATPEDYIKPHGSAVRYWLYMWNHVGTIDGYSEYNKDGADGAIYSNLRKKVFANMRYTYKTSYVYTGNETIGGWSSTFDSLRIFNYTSSQYVGIKTNGKGVYYDGVINDAVSVPADIKYPINYSFSAPVVGEEQTDPGQFLYISSAVPITYASEPHAVITLPTVKKVQQSSSLYVYEQTILPAVNYEAELTRVPERNTTNKITGALIPWLNSEDNYINFAYNPDDYTEHPDDYYIPTYTVSDNSKQDRISLVISTKGISGTHGEVTPSTPAADCDFITKTWNPGIAYFGGGAEVYVHLPAWVQQQISGYVQPAPSTNILVDISNYVIEDTYYIKIENAKCIRESSERYVNVRYAKFEAGDETPTTDPDNFGYGMLDIHTKTVTDNSGYKYVDYTIAQAEQPFTLNPNHIVGNADIDSDPGTYERYFFVGEIYQDFDSGTDTRYGGITLDAVENCRFIASSPLLDIVEPQANYLFGTQGDTFFQRFDALRIKPYSPDCENSVIDITSAMLETHINIDGRSDLQRGTRYIASLEPENFNKINMVYSQPDNFIVGRDPKESSDDDSFRSTITWTLEKADAAATDEWMHITLANTLKLDGDKGWCRALRRCQNSIVAFQDRCISEVLFNSRTQISTTEGVPIEIANSGKVDGKFVVTNNSGCINKWSIVEGKNALYFVDNINKAFNALAFPARTPRPDSAFNGSIMNISDKLGFGVWFREHNSLNPWNPSASNDNFVSYYDRIHSDVYLVGVDTDDPCLVYSEVLDAFTSFYDYSSMPMMTNVEDKFISFHGSSLWLQNEGLYCNFFGTVRPFYVQYRATPDPFGDKIWSNIEYRADFYEVLDSNGVPVTTIPEKNLIDGGTPGDYKENVTFDALRVWDEYQDTGTFPIQGGGYNEGKVDKRFRIWRYSIPRDTKDNVNNRYGFDRIRNPWANIEFKKKAENIDGKQLCQMHDAVVIYYE